MEQKDYILREIEKIGTIVRAILGKITGITQDEAVTVGGEFEQTTELMIQQLSFNIKNVLTLEKNQLKEYLSEFKGFNVANLELLAKIFYETGIRSGGNERENFLRKSLEIYEICNETDHTFSLNRESSMDEIRGLL